MLIVISDYSQRNQVAVPRSARELIASATVIALLTLLAISPSFLVDIPAMGDYLNHLARMHLLVTDKTADANPYYQVHWALYSNLAMEILVPQLARFMSVELAMKAFLIVSQLLIVTGAIAVELAIKRKHEIAGLAAIISLYGTPFGWGLLNFQFGMGLALWAIASWFILETRKWYTRLAVHSIFLFCLFFAHFFAVGIYGATIGLFESWRMFARTVEAKKVAWPVAIMVAPAMIVVAAMVMTGGAIGNGRIEWQPVSKLLSIFFAINAYNFALSLSCVAILIALLYILFREGVLSITPLGKWIAIGFLSLFIILPFRIFGTAYVDVRVVTASMLILPSFMGFSSQRQWPKILMVAIGMAIIIVNAAYVGSIWLSYRGEYLALKSSFGLIKEASVVLVGGGNESDFTEIPMHHAPTLAVHYSKALVPSLYTVRGLRPVELRPEFRNFDVSDPFYGPTPLPILKAVASGRDIPSIPQFISRWPQKYDYLYLVGPPISNPFPDFIEEVARGERFVLYRVTKCWSVGADKLEPQNEPNGVCQRLKLTVDQGSNYPQWAGEE